MRAQLDALLHDRIDNLRTLSYSELKTLVGTSMTQEVRLQGRNVSVQTLGFWDDRRLGHVRVTVNVDDGGLRAFTPLSDSFIVAPDGQFVGEDH